MSARSSQVLLVLALAVGLWPSLAPADPSAAFGPTVSDFGSVHAGETVIQEFRLHNAGDTALGLTGVRFTAPGMTARLPGEIEPGGDGVIVLKWTTAGVQGRVRAVAVVGTNDPRRRSVRLVLTGTVHGPIDIEPIPAVFLSSFRGQDVSRRLTLRSNRPRPVTMRLASPHGQQYVADLEVIEPGRSCQLTVRPRPATPPGRYDEMVALESDDPAIGILRLPVHVLVKADVYASPEDLDFGEVPLAPLLRQPAALRLLEQVVPVKARAGSLRLRGIRTDVAGLDLRVTPSSGPSGTFRIDAGLRAGALRPGSLEGTISVDTDDPRFPRLTVRVHGRIVE